MYYTANKEEIEQLMFSVIQYKGGQLWKHLK